MHDVTNNRLQAYMYINGLQRLYSRAGAQYAAGAQVSVMSH